jgi:multicomponent Na+:H+ antiporter subunit A
LGIITAIFAGPVGTWLIQPAASSILGPGVEVKLSLWHGINPMLILSALTLLLGLILYLARRPVQNIARRAAEFVAPISPESWYYRGLEGLRTFAAWQTSILQNGYMRVYLIVIIFSVSGMIFFTLLTRSGTIEFIGWEPVRLYDVVLAGTIIVAVYSVTKSNSRLATIAIMGMIGFSIALLFLLYGAPDLAMVQFAIETLVVILFVLVIYKLPKFRRFSSPRSRLVDAAIALLGGAVTTVLVLVITAQPSASQVTPFYVDASLPQAYGRNIVNVILVDFRGMDTLGEITVLALAAIGVYALTRYGAVHDAERLKRGVTKE